MGAIAEAIVAYAQPMLDGTDGSPEQMNRAFALSSMCYNLGTLPESKRAEAIKSLQASMGLNDADFESICDGIIYPMLDRYDEMFGIMSSGIIDDFMPAPSSSPARSIPTAFEPVAKSTEPLPYAPCPCNSGKKYKFCCKQTRAFAGAR